MLITETVKNKVLNTLSYRCWRLSKNCFVLTGGFPVSVLLNACKHLQTQFRRIRLGTYLFLCSQA